MNNRAIYNILFTDGDDVKIDIKTDKNIKETEISITCKKITPEIDRIVSAAMIINKQITVKIKNETLLINLDQIYYIESIDRKCFIYSRDTVYESKSKLYELEEQLKQYGFFRVSKSCLVNIGMIKSLKAEINRKIRITLNNGEQLICSRQYAENFKRIMEVK